MKPVTPCSFSISDLVLPNSSFPFALAQYPEYTKECHIIEFKYMLDSVRKILAGL
jgi:hypothetical protein